VEGEGRGGKGKEMGQGRRWEGILLDQCQTASYAPALCPRHPFPGPDLAGGRPTAQLICGSLDGRL